MFVLDGMDTMVVLRTAPQQSWTNPAERVMSVLNLGLQGSSLARTEMDTYFETTTRKCIGMSVIRRAAEDSRAVAKADLERSYQGQVAPSAQETSDDGNTIPIGEQQGDVLLDVSMTPVTDLAREEEVGGGNISAALETLDGGQETADDGSLLQGLGDVSIPSIVDIEDPNPCAPMVIELTLSSESETELMNRIVVPCMLMTRMWKTTRLRKHHCIQCNLVKNL